MSDDLYNIKRWDSVIINNTTIPYPLIYIKPDKNFLDFALINNNIIQLTIHDTDTIYDNKKITALVRSSIDTPNCRINFYNKTGYYSLILFADWHTYPSKLGYFTIIGIKQPEKVIHETFNNDQISKIVKHDAPSVESEEFLQSHEPFIYDSNSNIYIPGLTSYSAIWTSIIIFILLALVITISYYKK